MGSATGSEGFAGKQDPDFRGRPSSTGRIISPKEADKTKEDNPDVDKIKRGGTGVVNHFVLRKYQDALLMGIGEEEFDTSKSSSRKEQDGPGKTDDISD